MNRVFAFAAGMIFSAGLMLSGMSDPAKVLGFLDLAGRWDPSLAFVMGGAVLVGLFAFALASRRTRTFLDEPLSLPVQTAIDGRLVAGSLLFGAGWGLAGFCPGPALVALGMLDARAAVFVAAMLAGMAVFEVAQLGRRVPA